MPGVDYEEQLLYPKPPYGTSGTEHRDNFKTYYDATVNAPSASKAPFSLGNSTTSSIIGLPWTENKGIPPPAWQNKVWAPMDISTSAHFRPTSSEYGSQSVLPFHKYPSFDKAKESASVRYLQVPYLAGEMAAGAGLDARPVSSVSTFSLSSDRQAQILASGEQLLGERMAQAASWTAARSLRSSAITPVPNPYLTTTNASFQQRPVADSQQHRLRSFTTSAYVPARSLESAPTYVPSPALVGSAKLHETRYLGVRDSDGSRRILEIDTTGAPPPSANLPTAPAPPPEYPPSVPYVSSQPTSRNFDTIRSVMDGSAVDFTATPLPRSPLPDSQKVSVKHRRPFAMGYMDSFRTHDEHKITVTKKQAAAEIAAEALA